MHGFVDDEGIYRIRIVGKATDKGQIYTATFPLIWEHAITSAEGWKHTFHIWALFSAK